MTIVDKIKKEIQDFNKDKIEIIDGLQFNQKETIKTIYYYYNSKYKSGEKDSEGFKKYFYNIIQSPCSTATNRVDFDTADIKLLTAEGGDTLKTWFFEKDLKFWMKDNDFGEVLNRIFFELPIFGSVVIKMIDGEPHFVDLRNFITEQAADSLQESNYIIEIHNYTADDFRKVAQEKNWKNIDETIEAFRESENPYIRVYERWGDLNAESVEGLEGEDWTYARSIVADISDQRETAPKEQIQDKTFNLAVDAMKREDTPYREIHWHKIPGRWLGVGIAERLIDPQQRINELVNLQVKSSYYASLQLFQTPDETIDTNLLTRAKNGDVLNPEEPIERIPMEERNLHAYTQEKSEWLTNRDELTFSYNVMRGERLPAGTPLGSAQLAAGMASSYFDIIRENIAMRIKKFLYEDIIPEFKKDAKGEHILRLAGEDLDKINDLLVKVKTKRSLIDFIDRKGEWPDSKHRKLIEESVKRQVEGDREKQIKIPEGLYENIKYKLDIIISGEQEDTRVQASNLQMALQAVTTDPTILQDPAKRKIFSKILERGGINPEEIDMSGQERSGLQQLMAQAQQGRAGGGVSRPNFPNAPNRQQTERRL